MLQLGEQLEAQRGEVLTETRLQRQALESRWRQLLSERIVAGRALGNLCIREVDPNGLIHFDAPEQDIAIFREYDQLRLSKNDPEGDFHLVTFVGNTKKGLTIHHESPTHFAAVASSGWSLDEDFLDLSSYYLDALDDLGSTIHGREQVSPILFDEHESSLSLQDYNEACDSLATSNLDESQSDAVATALASCPFHLIQGPPGTGKTYTLALLVQELLKKGHHVLVTAFTHRAIHQALSKVQALLGDHYPIAKISKNIPGEPLPFPVFESYSDYLKAGHEGPSVIGATPLALRTSRLKGVHFDSIVLDETSQLTLPAAAMAMLQGDRWFFFGDHRQLPPVSLVHEKSPADASVFARLARNTKPSTLNTTYRLNAPLTEWPSENFYSGELRSHETIANHRLALKTPARQFPLVLAPEPSLLRMEFTHSGERARSCDEAEQTAELLLDLFNSGLSPSETGVVVPFRSQAAAIRQLLRGDRFANHPRAQETTVDTVNRFQGQEREVIIYSFTSSDPDFIRRLADFLFQPERLNVALTRAKTKVILLHSAALREFAENETYSEPAQLFCSLLKCARKVDSCP